jgi:hypothetical protein
VALLFIAAQVIGEGAVLFQKSLQIEGDVIAEEGAKVYELSAEVSQGLST